MKRAYVVVEDQDDAEFLRKILPSDLQKDVEFVPAGGPSSIESLASSLAVRRGIPVAVFMDSDSLNPEVIEERRGSMEEFIRFSAGSVPVKVVVVIPELESCFFAAPRVIEQMIGEKVPENLLPIGRRDPHGILDLLAATAKSSWDTRRAISLLDANDVIRIRDLPAIQELSAFLQKLLSLETVGAKKN